MTAQTKTDSCAGRSPRLADEGGFLLVMVMVVMLVLSAIAASTLINSYLERSLARNQNYASIAFQAAEAGLAEATTWLRENLADLPTPLDPTSPAYSLTWGDNPAAGTYWNQVLERDIFTDSTDPSRRASFRVTISYKREWRDYNGDDFIDQGEISPNREHVNSSIDTTLPYDGADIVFYNNCGGPLTPEEDCFDYPDETCKYSGKATNPFVPGSPPQVFPVVEIRSVGTYGSASVREVILDVARNKLNIRGAYGALTAKGSVVADGTVDIDGRNHSEDATSWDNGLATVTSPPECVDKPGAYVENGETATYNNAPHPSYHGTPPVTINDPAGAGHKEIYSTPWEVLGIEESEMPAPVSAAVATTRLDIASPNHEDFLGEITYVNGDYTFSGSGNYQGIFVVHNIAGTATLTTTGTIGFKGLIIADRVVIHGGVTIVGAVISMTTTDVDVSTGTPQILYSCAAIATATRQSYATKLAWHRVR